MTRATEKCDGRHAVRGAANRGSRRVRVNAFASRLFRAGETEARLHLHGPVRRKQRVDAPGFSGRSPSGGAFGFIEGVGDTKLLHQAEIVQADIGVRNLSVGDVIDGDSFD